MSWKTRPLCRLLLLLGSCALSLGNARLAAAPRPRKAAPPVAPFVGYHRYRGSVGGQRVTVELTIERDPLASDSAACTGSCRFGGRPTALHYLRSWPPYQAQRRMQLLEADSARPVASIGFWQMEQPAGPRLRGTWTGTAGTTLPFELREDYRDEQGQLAALPYEMLSESLLLVEDKPLGYAEWKARLTAWMAGGKPMRDPRATLSRTYLHFTGPDTLRPAIATLQCLPPAERRAQVLAEMQQEVAGLESTDSYSDQPLAHEDSYYLGVLYLNHGLLSLLDNSYSYHGGTHGGHSTQLTVYDLNQGDYLDLSDILLPGAERVLCRLLTQHLRTEQGFPADLLRQTADYPSVSLAPLPASGFALVDKGLYFQYGDYEIGGYVDGTNEMVLPWAEVLPLLRPDSPVGRMLHARGLGPLNTGWPYSASQ